MEPRSSAFDTSYVICRAPHTVSGPGRRGTAGNLARGNPHRRHIYALEVNLSADVGIVTTEFRVRCVRGDADESDTDCQWSTCNILIQLHHR